MVRNVSQAFVLSAIFLSSVLVFQASAADIVVYVDSFGEVLSGEKHISVHGTAQMPDDLLIHSAGSAKMMRNSNGTIEIRGEADVPMMLVEDTKGRIRVANKSLVLFFDAPVKVNIFGRELDNLTLPLSSYDVFLENFTGDFTITNATMHFVLSGKNAVLDPIENADAEMDGKKMDFKAVIDRSETESRIGEEKTAEEVRLGISPAGIEMIRAYKLRGNDLYVIVTLPFYYFLVPLGAIVLIYAAYRFRKGARKT